MDRTESSTGWIDAGNGYRLGLRDGSVVARSPKDKVLASVPKPLKDTPVYETLIDAAEHLRNHRSDCAETVESWMLRSFTVPRSVLYAVWIDPDWRGPLLNLVVAADGAVGILRTVEDRGVGIVDLSGETRWVSAETVAFPHPILLGDLDEWRAILAELGLVQDAPQLFRETFVKPALAAGSAVTEFVGGEFELLTQANHEARKLGYRVSAGCAVCRVWEGGGLVEARFFIGDEDPSGPTSTGELWWVDARQRQVALTEVGPVAFSEGMRMASRIYAKRKVASTEVSDV